jgi:hypothetical protein
MAEELTIENMKAQDVYENITKAGVSASDASVFVGDWLVKTHGGNQRVFDYKTAFATTEPDCTAHFTRTFDHADWVDGESVVQAGQTVGEDGFNLRLHHIEADLDSLGDDVRKAFECLAEMRTALASVLAEIKTELNRINADVFVLMSKSGGTGGGGLGGTVKTGTFLGAQKFFDKNVMVWETDQGIMMLPGIAPVGGDPVINPRIDRAVALSKLLAAHPEVGQAITGGMTKEQIIAQFGTLSLAGDPPMSELIDIVPADARFTDAAALNETVTEREAAAARTSGLADAVLAANFAALGATLDKVADVGIDATVSIPEATRTGLLAAGIATVGALAAASPDEVRNKLAAQGVDVNAPTAAGLVTQAKALSLIR